MAKVKEFTKQVEAHLFDIYKVIGMDKPENHEAILEFVANDVLETADPDNWHDGAVAIAFRRWIEEQNIPKKNGSRPNYFEVKSQGWNEDLLREEIQIHCGENGNMMIIKTEEGYIVDAYDVEGEIIESMSIWEDDINPLDEDDEDESQDIPNTNYGVDGL